MKKIVGGCPQRRHSRRDQRRLTADHSKGSGALASTLTAKVALQTQRFLKDLLRIPQNTRANLSASATTTGPQESNRTWGMPTGEKPQP